jgi:hypothetical protein
LQKQHGSDLPKSNRATWLWVFTEKLKSLRDCVQSAAQFPLTALASPGLCQKVLMIP